MKRIWAFPNIKDEIYRFETEGEFNGEYILKNGERNPSIFNAWHAEGWEVNGICEEIKEQ